MKRIHEEWPKEDPTAKKAAEVFAEEQDIH